jgi:MOSC domain-containing protein YiiM
MPTIHTQLIGGPRDLSDSRGSWRSAIYREPVAGPVALGLRGLAGDQVADTESHGSPDQAVCCHPLSHYAAWCAEYELPADSLGPGSVGENWTLSDIDEAGVCIGDIYAVGTALVQVSAPRYPCIKQERKLGLAGFLKRTMATLRSGWYLRVLTPGEVSAGDSLALRERPRPDLTIARLNAHMHHSFDPDLAQELLGVEELAAKWKWIIQLKLDKVI